VFDRSSAGSLTAGNFSPLTDGSASIWVRDEEGLRRLGVRAMVKLIDWEVAAVDFRTDGMSMAPARAIPRLPARIWLWADEAAVWEIHKAFAAQLIANLKATSRPVYRRAKAGVDFDMGRFPVDRINPYGGSIALGHPFGATGARILSRGVKELTTIPRAERCLGLCKGRTRDRCIAPADRALGHQRCNRVSFRRSV
jgi:acetyl-CoA C-acetyltransferase